MNSETHSQKVKSCNSCKRALPVNYFGLRKYSADGYNPCCKECRNFRRRRAYQAPINQSDPILSLNEHNRHFLWSLSGASAIEALVGLDLESLRPVKVTLDYKRTDIFTLTLNLPDGSIRGLLHQGMKAEFVESATWVLHRLKVRLFHSDDRIALFNWGLSHECPLPAPPSF